MGLQDNIIKTEEKNYLEILNKSKIDITKKYDRPPIVLSIVESFKNKIKYLRLCTLGNFSCVKGKAKTKKTFLLSMIVSPLINNNILYGKIKGTLPDNKKNVIWFDTEQGEYDSYIVNKRIIDLSKNDSDLFSYYNLREFEPLERCNIIDYALSYLDNVGFVIIDGVADLAKAINDEEEATRVSSLLLKWTKDYDLHISLIIHENKNNNFATGHLGSSIMKKAEAIINVENADDSVRVSCDMIRGSSQFEDFYFEIDEKTILPKIINSSELEKNLTKQINIYEPNENKPDENTPDGLPF